MKLHVKRGDEVVVLNGSHAGKRGKILEVFPAKARAVVEGVNLVTHYEKAQTKKDGQQHAGGLVKREASLHVSKLMRASDYDARKAKRAPAS
jgi:large subunit ribosomal protein L24